MSDSPKGAAGEFAPNVLLSETPLESLSVGYGSTGGRRGEITVADGRLYLVRPTGAGGVQTRHEAEGDEGALWCRSSPRRLIAPQGALGRRLAR